MEGGQKLRRQHSQLRKSPSGTGPADSCPSNSASLFVNRKAINTKGRWTGKNRGTDIIKLFPHPWKQRKNVNCSYVDGSREDPTNHLIQIQTDKHFVIFINMCNLNSVKCELQRETGSVRKKENKRNEDTERQQKEDRILTWRLGEQLPRENTGRKDNIYF